MKMRFMRLLCISPLALTAFGGCAVDAGEAGEGLQTDEESVAQARAALTMTSFFRMHNLDKRKGDFCLGVAAGTPTAGTHLITWSCDGSTNQQFKQGGNFVDGLLHVINGVISDPSRLVCLDAVAGSNNGSHAVINSCVQNFSQGWKPVFVGTENATGFPCFQFSMDGAPNSVLGVLGGTVNFGTHAGMWTNFNNFSTHPDQVWCLQQP